VYQGQKVYFFRSSVIFAGRGAAEAEQAWSKRHFLAEEHNKYFRRPHKLQSKEHHYIY
jgi:hypothetical protein